MKHFLSAAAAAACLSASQGSAQEASLHQAVSNGDFALAERLIKNGADVNAKDFRDFTPLHVAAGNWPHRLPMPMAQLLIDRGADVNVKNIYGFTPLHLAARYDHLPMVVLIDKGADMHAKDNDGCTPLHYRDSAARALKVPATAHRWRSCSTAPRSF